jgi:hypothetical protein
MSFWALSIDRGDLPLAEEEKAAVLAIIADQLPDQAQLVPLQAMNARGVVLRPPNVRCCGLAIVLLDRETYELGDPQGMAEGEYYEQLVPDRVAGRPSSLAQASISASVKYSHDRIF